MKTEDPDLEKQRLIQEYSAMADGELEQLAAEASTLTDAARDVLQQELARRGVAATTPPAVVGEDVLELEDRVTIRAFRDLPEALQAKGCLESAGIECTLNDTNLVRMDWFLSNLLGGVKLQVRAEDAEEAVAILNLPIPASFEVEGVGEFQNPSCPSCKSRDVSYEELNKPVSFTFAALGFPLPIHRSDWKCHDCGLSWKGEEVENSN